MSAGESFLSKRMGKVPKRKMAISAHEPQAAWIFGENAVKLKIYN